ncbi:hypothetical protein JZU51_01055, partial [bacterium]|nr:hypothetical protein [bacterium]
KDDKAAAPYTKEELDVAREALNCVTDAAPLHLETFEENHPSLLPRLYPYAPSHLLLRHEIDELFDTTADLSGADIDISRFIRSGEERDVRIFWAEVDKDQYPSENISPLRDALCAVPFLKARKWLCGDETKTNKESMRAWVWDWLIGVWKIVERRDLYPGQVILVSAKCGGYDIEQGWSPESRSTVAIIAGPEPLAEDTADSTQDTEALSMLHWQTITFHCRETGRI